MHFPLPSQELAFQTRLGYAEARWQIEQAEVVELAGRREEGIAGRAVGQDRARAG